MTADNGYRKESSRTTLGWGRAAILAGAWVLGGSVVLFPVLHWQGDVFLQQNWQVRGSSIAELIQTEITAVAVIAACLLGRHYRSWKFVFCFFGFSVIAVSGFALSVLAKAFWWG
jgi:hypothetical protein